MRGIKSKSKRYFAVKDNPVQHMEDSGFFNYYPYLKDEYI